MADYKELVEWVGDRIIVPTAELLDRVELTRLDEQTKGFSLLPYGKLMLIVVLDHTPEMALVLRLGECLIKSKEAKSFVYLSLIERGREINSYSEWMRRANGESGGAA